MTGTFDSVGSILSLKESLRFVLGWNRPSVETDERLNGSGFKL